MKNNWSRFFAVGFGLLSIPLFIIGFFAGLIFQALLSGWVVERELRENLIGKAVKEDDVDVKQDNGTDC